VTRRPLARALAASVDSAAALAVIEAARVLWATPELRTTAAFFSLVFAIAGIAFVCVFLVVLIVCAVDSAPLAARRALGVAALLAAVGALLAPSLAPHASVALLLVGVSAARTLLTPPQPARFGRIAAAAFCVLYAPVALVGSHSLRTGAIERGPFARAALAPIAARWPAPAVAERPARVAVEALPTGPRATPPLTLVIELDAIAPETALAMPAARLIARNSVVFVDARRATHGRSALGDWRERFDHRTAGVSHARCEWASGDSFESCATRALSTRDPLVLWLRASVADPQRADRALREVLRVAHARTPLSSAIVALTSQRATVDPNASTRALVMLSERSLRPSLVRGAVRVDELAQSIDALASARPDPLLDLARRRVPWFDRTVIVRAERDGARAWSAHNGRYSLVVTPARWGVALYDHELDASERVNRADALPALTRSMATALGARL
jgi:hypothetical protein